LGLERVRDFLTESKTAHLRGYFSPFFSHVAPAMQLKKGKNYPKMISFLLSAENPEHALIRQK
jgi:hypothetical protein